MKILPDLIFSLEIIPQIVDLAVDSNKLMVFPKNGVMERKIDLSFAYLVSAEGVLFNILTPCSSIKD
jgi:hypothetical protein